MRTALHAAFAGTLAFVAPAIGQWSFTRIADTTTFVPGSSTPFQFFNIPSIDDGVVAFAGFSDTGLTGPAGVYTGTGGALSVVVDRQTPSPSGGTFLGFSFGTGVWPSIDRGQVAFHAGDGTEGGVFFRSGATISPVGTTLTPIPNGGGATFMGVGSPSLEADRVVFSGGPAPSGPRGIYSWQAGALSVVADHTTPIPKGPGLFTSIAGGDIDNGVIVFNGTGAGGHRGLYRSDSSGLSRLYDSTMVVPGGNGTNFTTFSQEVVSDGRVAFYSQGGGTEGFYTDVSGALEVIANTNTPVPGFPGHTFDGFHHVSIDRGVVAIYASGDGRNGVYTTHTGTLARVIVSGDVFDGRIVLAAGIGQQSLDGQSLAIVVGFTNGDWGVYMATIPAPAASLAFAAALLWNTRRRRRPGVTGDRGTPDLSESASEGPD